jgi:hypothetical protein
MDQDFSKKVIIVVREDLPSWQVLNTVAHISAYLGNRLSGSFGTGEYFQTKDNFRYPRNSQYAIVILSGKQGQLNNLVTDVRASDLEYLGFVREMIETTDDIEIQTILSEKYDKDVEYLGVGLFGNIDKVKELTKKFSLWK